MNLHHLCSEFVFVLTTRRLKVHFILSYWRCCKINWKKPTYLSYKLFDYYASFCFYIIYLLYMFFFVRTKQISVWVFVSLTVFRFGFISVIDSNIYKNIYYIFVFKRYAWESNNRCWLAPCSELMWLRGRSKTILMTIFCNCDLDGLVILLLQYNSQLTEISL